MDLDDMTLKQIRRMDLRIIKSWLERNKEYISYDEVAGAWCIDGVEIVDELYYDVYSILHPKEIIGYVEEIIEDELEIEK